MKNSWIDTKKVYRPYLDDSNNSVESSEQYCDRIQKLLPNFPKEVLKQWFFEHWGQIDDYAWLEFSSLRFKQETWLTDMVLNSGIKNNPSVQIDLKHYKDGNHYPRQMSIVDYLHLNK